MAGKPNLFIIGAMKSGTTSLHNYLNLHPDIAMSEEKEPGFFVKELGQLKGERWYLDLFESAQSYRYRGESSTHYTKLPIYTGVAERIFEFDPNARLIYMMRDPFDRLISHYWHAVRDLHHGGERFPLVRAVQERAQYLAFGDYAMQLGPYLKLFGRDAVFTLTFESLLRDPQPELNRLFDWLQLDRYSINGSDIKPHNQKPENFLGVAGTGLLNRIQYSRAWDGVSHLVPPSLKEWAKKIAYKEVDEAQTAADAAYLRTSLGDRLQHQIDTLSRLLNRDFPEWASYRQRHSGSSSARIIGKLRSI